MKKPDLFSYTDYRGFLQSYCEFRKESSRDWNMTSWSKDLGLKSRSMLCMLLNGQRDPGPVLVVRFQSYFSFTPREAMYFDHLVSLQRTKNMVGANKAVLIEQLKKLNPKQSFIELGGDEFHQVSRWYFFVLREMVDLKGFKENINWIVRRIRLPISPNEIRSALNKLLALGLLKRDSRSGSLLQGPAHISSTDELPCEYVKRHTEESLDHAKKALRACGTDERYMSCTTLAFDERDLEKAKAYFRHFEEEFLQKFSTKNANQVMQMNIQFFPYLHTGRGHDETH